MQNVPQIGFSGKRNGELLDLAEDAGFDILLTVDKGVTYQQNLKGRAIAVLIISAQSNKLNALLPHVPACLRALRSIKAGQLIKVSE